MKCLLARPIQLEEYIDLKCELKISSCLYTNITAAARGRVSERAHTMACQVVFCVLASSLSEWKTIKSSFCMHNFCPDSLSFSSLAFFHKAIERVASANFKEGFCAKLGLITMRLSAFCIMTPSRVARTAPMLCTPYLLRDTFMPRRIIMHSPAEVVSIHEWRGVYESTRKILCTWF